MGRHTAWALLAASLLAAAVPNAAAHAFLAHAQPGPGDDLGSPPALLRLTFTESVEHSGTRATVVGANGTHWETTSSFPSGTELDVELRPLPDGTYTVQWDSRSLDTHTASGSYAFAVHAAAAASSTSSSATHLHAAIDQAFLLLGLVGALGIVLFVRFALPPSATSTDRQFLLDVAGLVGVAGALGALLTLGDGASGLGFWDFLTKTHAGPLWLLRAACMLGALPLLFVHGRQWPRARLAWGPALLLGAAAALTSWTSHAAALPAATLANEALDLTHLLAASLWMGGVLAFLAWLPGKRPQDADEAVRRFSPWAVGAVAVLAMTGTVRAIAQLPRLATLWTSAYGWALDTKVLLLAVLVGLGALNRYRLGPALRAGGSTRALRRSLAAEALLLLGVLLATALLTSTSPPPPT